MSSVRLTGELICRNEDEAAVVEQHLPAHLTLTREEQGCVLFDVERTENPLVWQVSEEFVDQVAFEHHQSRVAASIWGRATAGIERQYVIKGLN